MSSVQAAMTAEWLDARNQLETKLQAVLTSTAADHTAELLAHLHTAVTAVFPEAAAVLASGGGAEAAAAGDVDGGDDKPAGSLDRQLVEHCFFRVLGTWRDTR